MTTKEKFEGFFAFFGIVAYLVGTVTGVLNTWVSGNQFSAVCIAVLAGMAFPTAKRWLEKIFR